MLNKSQIISEFIEDLPVGIASANMPTQTLNTFNQFFEDLFGWNNEEINTLEKWSEKAYPNEEYRKEVIAKWTQLIEETEEQNLSYSKPIEVSIKCKDGSSKTCEVIYYRHENISYGIFIDITHRKKIEKKLISTSFIDELTQTNNRKSYNKRIFESLSLYNRYKTPFSILMFDIDNFKHVNDTYGHNVGDKVLIEISNSIKTLIRKNDYLFRVGGEEFVIILSDTKMKEGKLVSDKICKEVSELQMIEDEKITISIGLTEVKDSDTDDSIYRRVDSLLYFSKLNGKNRVSTEIVSDVRYGYYFDEERKTLYEKMSGSFGTIEPFRETLMDEEFMKKYLSCDYVITDHKDFDMNFDHYIDLVTEVFLGYKKTFEGKDIKTKKAATYIHKFDNAKSAKPFRDLQQSYGIETQNFNTIDEISDFIGFDTQKYFNMTEKELTVHR